MVWRIFFFFFFLNLFILKASPFLSSKNADLQSVGSKVTENDVFGKNIYLAERFPKLKKNYFPQPMQEIPASISTSVQRCF